MALRFAKTPNPPQQYQCLTSGEPVQGWILTPSATPWGARAHQGKIGFSLPRRRLPLHFEDAKAAPRKGKSSRYKALGCCTSRRNSGSHPGNAAYYDFLRKKPNALDRISLYIKGEKWRIASKYAKPPNRTITRIWASRKL